MTTRQPHPCRCETCPYSPDRGHDKCPVTYGDTGVLLPSDMTALVTSLTGCLSHPKAREYLNVDVIRELERMKDNQSGLATEAHFVGARTAYKRALALLRGERS